MPMQGLGKQGVADAMQTCSVLASKSGCNETQVLPFSTGVIGEKLPVDKITQQISTLLSQLDENQWLAAANAIMTTDTVAKGYSEQLQIGGETVSITGIAKGSGMIRPDMATMLAYVATDLNIEDSKLNELLTRAVDQSFHCITVDGDTSTNDAAVLMSTGSSDVMFNELSDEERVKFENALNVIFVKSAQAIIRDGEGVTKFITVSVEQAKTDTMAKEIAFTIANSPLVKTAAFASDPNWGRILAAAGRATNEVIDIEKLSLFINDLKVIDNGEVATNYNEDNGQFEMQKDEIKFRLLVGDGEFAANVWTTDLSYDYVKINAEYRS